MTAKVFPPKITQDYICYLHLNYFFTVIFLYNPFFTTSWDIFQLFWFILTALAIKDAASLPYILFCICSSKSCICFPHSYEEPLQWASMCKLPPLLELRLPPLKHLTLLPLFAIPINNSLSLHFLSAFTPCRVDAIFLSSARE